MNIKMEKKKKKEKMIMHALTVCSEQFVQSPVPGQLSALYSSTGCRVFSIACFLIFCIFFLFFSNKLWQIARNVELQESAGQHEGLAE